MHGLDEPLVAARVPRGLATTVLYVHPLPTIALGRAVKAGRVQRDVAMPITGPAQATPKMHPLSAHRVRSFHDAIRGDRFEALDVTANGTRLRQGGGARPER